MGLGGTEIVILLVLVLLFFGGKRLPQLGSALGKAMTNFKSGLKEDKEDKES
ncbi:MAG: twin-arginine translocase TatA/TatE family subunit [Epsilonproteobacteria bacterium]|nr:MAG: twin-arginine translocase TatA/TatE family subunit [Campylobacterota bacterium]RLA63870.1 MAG: twin-arginine translocase TatA/TatE family subunit [Campylobacterota bacterium]